MERIRKKENKMKKEIKYTSQEVGKGLVMYFIEGTGIYSESFKELRKFAREFKNDILEYMSEENGNYGFLFHMCGYSSPVQNAFRKAYPHIGC